MLGIGGLSLSIATVLLISIWGIHELSYDRFHDDSDRIYRVIMDAHINDQPLQFGGSFGPMGPEAT